jgi:hypothetical protein
MLGQRKEGVLLCLFGLHIFNDWEQALTEGNQIASL